MYEYISGIYMGIYKDYIIVENSGIGYRIFTSGSTIANMPEKGTLVKIYVEQIVREDFIGIYGFLTKEEIDMFNLIKTVSGVGAKACLSLLSINSVNNLKYAILISDEKSLMRASGVGKKTAQRIILELKDKFKNTEVTGSEAANEAVLESENMNFEAISALISLGYTESEAKKAVNNVKVNDSVENIIKECLKFLMK